MDCYITYCLCGFLAFDENQNLITYKLFSKDEIVAKLIQLDHKELVSEEIEIINKVSNSYEKVIIESKKRYSDYSNLNSFDKILLKTPNNGGEFLRNNLEKILIEVNFSNKENLKEDLNNIYKKLAISKMKEISQHEDLHLIQSINSIDEIDEGINKLIERIREWYALYFPEMDLIKNNEAYIKLICENKTKEEIIAKRSDAFLINISDFNESEINEEDLKIINEFASSIYNLQIARKNIEEYIENKMEKIAPNLKNLVGASLGAKLISHAGGIKRLATYPSSTIQIIGAEKALFRHLKTGENPPKHGIIFQHPSVRNAKWWNRGKIARTLSLKISLSVRKDVFSKDFNKSIAEEFKKQVEKIEKDNPFPKKTTKRRREERNKKPYSNEKKKHKGKKRNKRNIKVKKE